MGIDLKGKLWNLGGSGGIPPPPPRKCPPQKIQIYAIYPEVIFMEINSTFLSAPLPTGTTSVTTRWKPPRFKTSNDWLPPQAPSYSHTHSPLITAKLKSRSLTARNQAPMCSKLHFLINFHFQLNWYSSSVKWPPSSYWSVCYCLGMCSS